MISFREWLNEREGVETEYQKFFKKKLEKYGVDSPAELSGEDKKKFFDEIDAEWEAENEEPEAGDVNESSDKILEDLLKDVSALYEKFNKAEQKIKIFSQSKLTEVKVKIMDALEK